MRSKMQFGLQPEVIEKIRSVFVRHSAVDAAILYGSRAKGNFRPGSDIDLTFKGSGLTLSLLNRIDGELDDLLLPWTFDLSIYSQIENPDLVEHIERVGIVFYERAAELLK
jgi:predicted nucleotidyltransferase